MEQQALFESTRARWLTSTTYQRESRDLSPKWFVLVATICGISGCEGSGGDGSPVTAQPATAANLFGLAATGAAIVEGRVTANFCCCGLATILNSKMSNGDLNEQKTKVHFAEHMPKLAGLRHV